MTKAERARKAREALNNPAVVEAIKQLETDAFQTWSATDLSDQTKREISYFQLKGAQQVLQQLDNWSRETERTGDK